MNEQRPYAGRSLDERRSRRRAQLIEAGLDCLFEQSLSGISVRTICARARLTDRYFYESFPNLDTLLAGLVDSICDQLTDAATAINDQHPTDLVQQISSGVSAAFSVVLDDPRKASVLLAARANLPMQACLQARLLAYADMLTAAVSAMTPSGAAPEALRRRALFLIGGALELLSGHLSGLFVLSRRDLIDECAELILQALPTRF